MTIEGGEVVYSTRIKQRKGETASEPRALLQLSEPVNEKKRGGTIKGKKLV